MEKVNNAFYDDLGEDWYECSNHPIALLRAENEARVPWIIEQIQTHHSEGCQVLDIGCGAGFLTNALAQQGCRVTGIDLSQKSLEVAQKKDKTASVSYLAADATKLPFKEASFDVVSALDLLEHVEDPEQVIKEASRVLKPGGLFFFHTFNRHPLSWLIVLKGVEWFVKNTPKNMHVYRLFLKPKELKSYCQDYQMDVLSMEGLVPDIQRKAFWKMLVKREIPDDFSFRITNSLTCGYMGMARKQE